MEIIGWLDELDGPSSPSREVILAARLSKALEGYMGVEKEILNYAFLAARRRRRALIARQCRSH
jgi:hypothetical protein